jgi:hypothetical protein
MFSPKKREGSDSMPLKSLGHKYRNWSSLLLCMASDPTELWVHFWLHIWPEWMGCKYAQYVCKV